MKYRKKPVVIEALEWTGVNIDEMEEFLNTRLVDDEDGVGYLVEYKQGLELMIKTLEGDHRANFGDYIIKGVKGEFYPCKPDIFKMTYVEVEKENSVNNKTNISNKQNFKISEIKNVDKLHEFIKDLTIEYSSKEDGTIDEKKYIDTLDVFICALVSRLTAKFFTMNPKLKKKECRLMLVRFFEGATNRLIDSVYNEAAKAIKKYKEK